MAKNEDGDEIIDGVPDERDIRKQELWKRIDDAGTAMVAATKDLHSRIDQFQTKLTADWQKITEATLKDIDSARLSLVSQISEAAKNIEVGQADKAEEFAKLAEGHMVILDRKAEEFRTSVAVEIGTQVRANFGEINQRFKDLSGQVAAFQRDINAGIQKTLNDNAERLAQTQKRVQDIEERLKKVFGSF